jgi:sugar lactone lactonase YvrE
VVRTREVRIQPVDMPQLELGEGARWLADGPVQVDLLAGRLLTHRNGNTAVALELGVPLGAVAPRAGGGLAAIAGTGVWLREAGDTAPWRIIDTGEDPAVVRVNDGVADAAGRLWFTLMRYDQAEDGGSVWRLDPDLSLTRVLTAVTVPNGPLVDEAREALYVADSARGVIHRHPLDLATGELGPGARFAEVSDASPDGMALDVDGGVWSAQFGAARLHRYGPDGELTDVVPLPVRQPTSVALDPRGGPALVNSAGQGLEQPGPLDGRSLWVDLGASGALAAPFGSG